MLISFYFDIALLFGLYFLLTQSLTLYLHQMLDVKPQSNHKTDLTSLTSSHQTTQASHHEHTDKPSQSSKRVANLQEQEEVLNQFMHLSSPFDHHQTSSQQPQIQQINQFSKILSKNRSKTQGKQEKRIFPKSNKPKTFLPQLSTNILPQESHLTIQKTIKLKQLYEKKNKLRKKLEFVNKKLINTKLEQSFLCVSKNQSKIDSTLEMQTKLPSKSYSNSRNNQYPNELKCLLDSNKRKAHIPSSMTSPQKNREVISFIQRMHQESVKRDLNRYTRSQKVVQNQLNHVCLECSRSKCQEDVLDRIMKQSRLV